MLHAAKITLKEAKNALNTLIRILSCVDNYSICTKHNLIIDGEKPVRGDGLHGNNCEIPPLDSTQAFSLEKKPILIQF